MYLKLYTFQALYISSLIYFKLYIFQALYISSLVYLKLYIFQALYISSHVGRSRILEWYKTVTQLVEALRHKKGGSGFDSR